MIRAILNLLWFILGGVFMGFAWWFFGLLAFITIVGIPWGLQCFKLVHLVLLPFGKRVISDNSDAGCLSTLLNIILLIWGCLYTTLVHLVMGLLVSITIISIPWARQHFKLIEISLCPLGKRSSMNNH